MDHRSLAALLALSVLRCTETASINAPGDGGARDVPAASADGRVAGDVPVAAACVQGGAVDLLLVIDNTGSMPTNQASFARALPALLDALQRPTAGGAMRSLHVGVVSTDLGTPGSQVPSCANSDIGDDGRLNPVLNGPAIRSHQPWTYNTFGARPPRCEPRRDQFPPFLLFDASFSNATMFTEEIACTAVLSIGGCGLEQQLEAAYRAVRVHDASRRVGNTDVNAGFLRDDSVFALLLLTDEEDGSVRDCRWTESGDPDGDCSRRMSATAVFDTTSPDWASVDLNLRGYLYIPGSAQDPTWNLNRYVDPANPRRGFLGVRPGRERDVVFGAITGVPLGMTDLDALLGAAADGSQGYTGMSAEGPVSMRQRNMDPNCSTRVVPACRREGSDYVPEACDTTRQYFALPARRIVEVARRVQATVGNGVVGSICANDYAPTMRAFAAKVSARLCP
jgi:hypothetical protein